MTSRSKRTKAVAASYKSRHAARVDRSRNVVLEASAALIMERGPAAFTIEALVERTGVAKSTIYRHWPTRRELMAAVFGHMTQPASIPDTGTLRGDLQEFFVRGVRALKDDRWDQHLQSLPGLIEASKRDPDLAAVGTDVLSGTIQWLMPVLERARARDEVRADVSLEAMAHILLGSMFIHRALDGDLSETYVFEVIGIVLDGIAPHTALRKPLRLAARTVSAGRSARKERGRAKSARPAALPPSRR